MIDSAVHLEYVGTRKAAVPALRVVAICLNAA